MTPEEARGLAGYLFQTLDTDFAITRKLLAAVPADQLNFKLGEKGRTTAELMWHMVQSDCGFAEGIASSKLDSFPEEGPSPKTAAEIVAAFDRDIPPLLERVKSPDGGTARHSCELYEFRDLADGDLYRLVGE